MGAIVTTSLVPSGVCAATPRMGMALIIEVVLLLAGRETKMRDALGFAGFSPHGSALVKAD